MWHHIFINYEIAAKILVTISSDSLLRWEKTRHAASTVNLFRTWLINTADYFHRQLLFSRSLTHSVNPRSRHFHEFWQNSPGIFCLNKTWLWWRQREIIWNQGEVKSRPSEKIQGVYIEHWKIPIFPRTRQMLPMFIPRTTF